MKPKLFLTFILFLSMNACRQPISEITVPEVVRIKTAALSKEKMSFPIRASGLIVPAREVKLSFKTGGIIAAINADEGARVKKGTLLAILDLSEIEAQVKQASNGLDKANRDYTRAKNLYADSVATLEQYQNAETAMNVAKAMLDAATFNRDHSRIFAPDDGVILRRLMEANEVVAPGYPVFLFGTTGMQWKIKVGLADRNYVKISPGDSAVVTIDAYPGEQFSAIVTQLGEAANPMTGTYEVELNLLSTKNRLASGFVANLEIIPSHTQTYYRLPVEAILGAEGQTGHVFAITDSATVKKVKVHIAGIFDNWAAVSGELNDIEEVATGGSAYLSDGDHITIVR
jgi:multidrug efflux system membrane fusion protein